MLPSTLLLLILSSSLGPDGGPPPASTTPSPPAPQVQEVILRIAPASFPDLPRKVRDDLQRRGCTVPQTFWPTKEPNNVISGEFAAKGQKDWAVLCSIDGVSRILVYWGGAVSCPNELHAAPDSLYTQGGSPYLYFSRAIVNFPAGSKSEFGAPPEPHPHDAIEDHFVEKASRIYYCHRGEWTSFQGMD